MSYESANALRVLEKADKLLPTELAVELVASLDALLASPPETDAYLPLLEQFRAPLASATTQLQQQFLDRSLPMGGEEDKVFQLVITACRRMINAYSQLTQLLKASSQEPWYPYRMAVLLQRVLFYTSQLATAHYMARRELPAGLWVEMHRAFAVAESLGVAPNRVDDPLETHRQASSCTAVYVAAQLLALASPFSLNPRSLKLVIGWADLWAPLVSIDSQMLGDQMPPLVVNLSLDQGVVSTIQASKDSPFYRFLDTSRLEFEIRRTLKKLREKTPPGRLGLGEDAPSFVIRLVGRVARPWAQLVLPRRHRRVAAQGNVSVSLGFESIHFHVSGKEFSTPDATSVYTRDVYDSRVSSWHQVEGIHSRLPKGIRIEHFPDVWRLLDSSAQGFKLTRSNEGKRVSHGQLLGIQVEEGASWFLAVVSSLTQENRGGLTAGLFVLSGEPKGIAFARLPDDPAIGLEFVRAFILPAVPSAEEEASLVVPAGLFYPGKRFEFRQEKRHIQGAMKHLLDKGADFEHFTFTLD